MSRNKKKSSSPVEGSKKGAPSGGVIILAVIGGVIIGSVGTFALFKPQAAPPQSAAAGTPPAQTLTVPSMPSAATLPSQQQQFTPAPQPPGEPPPGKVWSPEHGHWHDAPSAVTIPMPVTATTETIPAPTPGTVTPAAAPTPAPTAPPADKKE